MAGGEAFANQVLLESPRDPEFVHINGPSKHDLDVPEFDDRIRLSRPDREHAERGP